MRALFANTDVRKESLYIGALALLLFTAGIWAQPFVDFDSRFALFAQEMWRQGPTWFPTTYGEPYADYPVTSTFLIWLFSLPFGAVTKLSAILPTALAAALNLAITYRLLAQHSRRWALATVCFELLTVTFLDEARSISLDHLVATVTLSSFYLAYTAPPLQTLSRWFALSALLIIGFAIRGPLGLIIPTSVVFSYYLLSSQWRKLLQITCIATAILLICWLGLLGLAKNFYGAEFADDVVHMQVAGRMESNTSPRPWYYFISSFGNYALSYPIAVLTLALLTFSKPFWWRAQLRSERESFLIYMVGWILIVMAGLSIPHTKKIRYLLPMMPAIAALAAYLFVESFDRHKQRALILARIILEKLFLVLPTLALIGMWVAFHHAHKSAAPIQLPFAPIAGSLLGCQAIAIAVQWRLAHASKTLGLLLSAVFTVWILNLLILEPLTLQLHDTRTFVRQVEALRQQQPGQVAFFRVGKDAAAIKYLVNLDYGLQPQFLNNSVDLDALNGGAAYIIVRDKELPQAQKSMRLRQLTPVLHDRFDHDYYTVFYLHGTAALSLTE